MVTSSKSRSSGNGPVLGFNNQRSKSPPGRSTPSSYTSGFASSTSSSFSSGSTGFFRSTSPTRVNMVGSYRSSGNGRSYSGGSSSSSIRFSYDNNRSLSPSRSIAVSPRDQVVKKQHQKKSCMCSPTNHPGSFRCSLHKSVGNQSNVSSYPSNRLNARRSAMTNSLVRIGTVEGDLVRRALAALIRPSSHHQRRRAAFQPRPSRLSNMTKADSDSITVL